MGLVHYPTTLAPVSGSVTVTAQCADNAHIRSGSSLSVRCTSTGSWSRVPQCQCDEGYQVDINDGREICQGSVQFFPSVVLYFHLQQHNITYVIHVSVPIPLPPLLLLSVLHLLSVQHVLKLHTLSVQPLQMGLIIKPVLNTLTDVLRLHALSVLHVPAVNPVMILLHFNLLMIQPVLNALHVLMIQLVLTVQLTSSMVSPLKVQVWFSIAPVNA